MYELQSIKTYILVMGMTFLLLIFPCKTFLQVHRGNPASAHEAHSAPKPVTRSQITFAGGPGHSLKTAVVISGAPNAMAGIAAEYRYLKQKFGRENVDWILRDQSMVQHDHKVYDRLDLDLKGERRTTVFFDISEFFGKL